jgi:hypothetical protein
MKRLLCVLLVLFSIPSYAAVTWRPFNQDFTDPLEACKSGWSDPVVKSTIGYRMIHATRMVCTKSGVDTQYASDATGSCDAPTVYNPQTGRCDAPPVCPASGTSRGAGSEAYIDRLSVDVCQGGCGYTAAGAMKAGDKYIAFGPFVATGSTCTATGGTGSNTSTPSIPDSQCSYRNPSTGVCESSCPTGHTYQEVPSGAMACVKPMIDTNPTPPDTTCPRGYMNISLNSTPNCAPTGGLGAPGTNSNPVTCPAGQHSVSNNGGVSYCAFTRSDNSGTTTAKTESPTTTATNADGSTTTSTTTTVKNKDGSTSTTTTTTTTGTDGAKSVNAGTTTTKTPAGKDGVPDAVGDNVTDLCKRNPNLNICQNSTVSGSNSTVTCTGDAIQCATLRLFSKVFDDTPTANSTLGNQVMDGNDPAASTLPKANATTVNVSTSLNQNGWLGGGACFPNKIINVGGQSFEIPFDAVCPYLIPLRAFLMLITALVCFRIVSSVVFSK